MVTMNWWWVHLCVLLSPTFLIVHSQEFDDIFSLLNDYQSFDNLTRHPRFLNIPFNDEIPSNGEVFDFIVVGSGSAGSVIANRLSEIADWKILLLEVGEYPTVLAEIPAIAALFQFTNLNWGYLMEKQPNMCLGLQDQRMHWPRGRGLGGTTLINYMIHIRGNKYDYDKWAGMGNPGWSYNEVLPYFLKSEDSMIKYSDPQYHTKGGYLSVTDIPFRTPSVDAFVQACQEAGHKYVDYNGREQLGVSYVQGTLRRGKRCSAERCFLRPVYKRPNLKILTGARVTKLLINPENNQCYGVKYVKNRKYYTARVSKEVILSAGAFNSPQLLMLSGIGPKDHLQELGIPVLYDLPVGQKLYDHICFLGLTFTINQTIVSSQDALTAPSSFLQLLQGQGPLTSIGGVEALLYYQTPVAQDPRPVPDMEIIYISGQMSTDRGQFYRTVFRITDEVYNAVWRPYENASVWGVFPMLLHPRSYGYLRLKSKNPYHWPKFYGNYFTDPGNQDIQAFIAAIREMERIIQAPAYQKLGTRLVENKVPGCEHFTFDTDEYWECALRHISATLHHQITTCKMGPSDDPEAVVDHKLRVYGVANLRVADTSIIPTTLSAHTSVPTYMVGEKAADLLKEEWMVNRPSTRIDIRSPDENK